MKSLLQKKNSPKYKKEGTFGWGSKIKSGISSRRLTIHFLILVIAGGSIFITSYLIAHAAYYYRSNTGSPYGQVFVNEGTRIGRCYDVRNSSGNNIFIPAKTVTEFDSFKNKTISGIVKYEGMSDYGSDCCFAGSACNDNGWATAADCVDKMGGSFDCGRNSYGCYGNPCGSL